MSSSAQDLLPQVDLGNTFGALFIGVTLSAVLFGLTNVQIFIYFQTHKDTRISIFKLIVIWLWITDALHLALIIHCVYYYLVTNYANFNALTEIVWSFKPGNTYDIDGPVQLQVILDVLIVCTVQFSYVYRIWIVSKGQSRVLWVVITFIVVVLSVGVSIPLILVQYRSHVFQDMVATEWASYLCLGSTTFNDILIASSLCYLLATSRTGFSTLSDKCLFNNNCNYCEVPVLALSMIEVSDSYLYMGFLVTKLYVNSFMALMNAGYYLQVNTGSVGSSKLRVRHDVYRPELRIDTSQDDKPQTDVSDDVVLHTTRPTQTVMRANVMVYPVANDGEDGNGFFLVGVIDFQ
ncbi:hypothetical protein BDR03DRAFT_984706 [Suillus americanus]|nr:hypothetical protein BDR03DRAFT_984706 [Suillus americanus]